jgi:hypothetical protein
MPTKKETIEFIKVNKPLFKSAGLTAPSGMNVRELNKEVDKVVEKMPKKISDNWKKMKMLTDGTPQSVAVMKKLLGVVDKKKK